MTKEDMKYREDIIRIAREAGGSQPHDWRHNDTDLERFAHALSLLQSARRVREMIQCVGQMQPMQSEPEA